MGLARSALFGAAPWRRPGDVANATLGRRRHTQRLQLRSITEQRQLTLVGVQRVRLRVRRQHNLETWLQRLEGRVAQTSARGAHLLVLPEYACAQWLSFAPADLPKVATMGWLSECGRIALDAIAIMAAKWSVTILPGTMPFPAALVNGMPTFLNRAWLMMPDGTRHAQDKLSLTPQSKRQE